MTANHAALREKFEAGYTRGAEDECWEWAGHKHQGYGFLSHGGRRYRAHRLAYEFAKGPIPDGLVTDHLCRNPGCVNPAHLEAVTNRENVLRGIGPSAQNARKTHCGRGHYIGEGHYWLLDGKRVCKKCARQRWERKKPNMPDRRPRGKCSVCGSIFRLNKDGTVVRHRRLPRSQKLPMCEGSSKVPA